MSDLVPPRHLEFFEVVCVKPNVNALTAAPADFVRIPVQATDPLQAIQHDDVRKKVAEGYSTVLTSKPGLLSPPEILARSRAQDTWIDRSKW